MLIDQPAVMLDLFLENLVRGVVTYNHQILEKLDKVTTQQVTEDRENLIEWYRIRKEEHKPSDYSELMSDLCESIIHWRTVGVLHGELKDVISEERIKKLEEEKTELIEIISDQKKKLDGLYIESPDKKNIRGIV